jgi:hypothetical protein
MDQHRIHMKEVCNHLAEIKRVIKESNKQLTKEEREAIKAYRHKMLERIQAADEMHKEKELEKMPKCKSECKSEVFVKWKDIAKTIPSNIEFK